MPTDVVYGATDHNVTVMYSFGRFLARHPGNVRQAEKPAESLPQARNRPQQGKRVLKVIVNAR